MILFEVNPFLSMVILKQPSHSPLTPLITLLPKVAIVARLKSCISLLMEDDNRRSQTLSKFCLQPLKLSYLHDCYGVHVTMYTPNAGPILVKV